MKFIVTKELKNNKQLKYLILFLLFGMGLFLIFDVANHAFLIGSNPSEITSTLLGNKEEFIEPILIQTLLQIIHADIFFSLIILILLSLIYLRISEKNSILIHVVFISSLLSHISLLTIYWLGINFVLIWLTLFMLWHVLAVTLIAVSVWNLIK